MTIDKENGWSKGFGFVSFATVEEADAAMMAVHGSWMAGREMKVRQLSWRGRRPDATRREPSMRAVAVRLRATVVRRALPPTRARVLLRAQVEKTHDN